MCNFVFLAALLLCFGPLSVDGGSWAFQPPLQPPPNPKRWTSVTHGVNDADTQLWPNKEIRYAFQNLVTEYKYWGYLREASELWH